MSSIKNSGRSRLWRSLAEYENDPKFQKYLENEFGVPLTESAPNSTERRRFMQLMSASFALAGAAGCRWEEDKLMPLTRRPEGVLPGVPRYYNTAMELGAAGLPLRVKNYDGRPIKVDGNPDHPASGGPSRVYEQASILGMYDPDRSTGPAQYASGAETESDWVTFKTFALKHFRQLRAAGGAGLAVLAESSSSTARSDMQRRFMEAYPQAQWFEYEPVNRDNVRQGAQLAFGGTHRNHIDYSRAEVVLTLDADPLFHGAESVAASRGFGAARDPESGNLNRLWAVESSLSCTGLQADHRLAIRWAQVSAFAVALESQLSKALGQTATQTVPQAAFLADPVVAKYLATLVKDLAAHQGKCAVVVGDNQPPMVHALGHRLNALLSNVGETVTYTAEYGSSDLRNGLKQLVSNAGQVQTLLILDGNPVYSGTGDVDFASVLTKIPTSIHLSLYRDETSRRCTWHLPLAHYLEAWGDCAAPSGSRLIAQPLIEPLFEGMSAIEFLGMLARDPAKNGAEIVRRALKLTDDRAWARAVHDGYIAGSESPTVQPEVRQLAALKLSPAALTGLDAADQIEVTFVPDTRLYDGRFANNGWLQETPEHAMKLTWDNAAFINPKTAAALGIKDSTLITLSVGNSSITVPALMAPAHPAGSIKLLLGFGRTDAGIVGGASAPRDADPVEPVGVNVYPLRTTANWDAIEGVQVVATGEKFKLATTQDKHPMDDTGREGVQGRLPQIVRQDTLAGFKEDPDHVQHVVHHPPLLSLWHEPIVYDGYKWGMAVDLNKCTSCNACVVACNAENNIPVVGKEQVLMGRELHWMRIDRYFQGEDADEPEQVHVQPMLCQHCEHAPCEQVCPVGATVHSADGLNEMTYNRCIGTRYCSNNCPYKVRRFNYFNFNLDLNDERNAVKRMVQNPEVTVRFRGVMEKCTFCVQRIQDKKIAARNVGRRLKPNEVTSACHDACPTGAIVFGDLNNSEDLAAQKVNTPRAYSVLQELNTRPRVRYLARITNPHPDLAPVNVEPGHENPAQGEPAHGKLDGAGRRHGKIDRGSKATEGNSSTHG